MLKLWLARHGEAVDPDSRTSDFERTLTATGRRQLAGTTQWLVARVQRPDLILYSPLVRARQTAETIAAEIGDDVVVRVEHALAPGIEIGNLLKQISDSMSQVVVCVGHQPDMSHCLAQIIGGGSIQYLPGTIAGVEFGNSVTRGNGRLCWLTNPRWFP